MKSSKENTQSFREPTAHCAFDPFPNFAPVPWSKVMLAGATIAVNAAVTTRKAVSFLKEVANIEDSAGVKWRSIFTCKLLADMW